MSTGWNGPDPVERADPQEYELGTQYLANTDITVSAIRIYTGAGEISIANRTGRLWTTGGAELGRSTISNDPAAGWSVWPLDTPVEVLAGTSFKVSYSTGGNEATLPNALDASVLSSDGAVTAVAASSGAQGNGSFGFSAGVFPTTPSGNNSFYGADIVYTVGIGGNTPPRVTALTVQLTGGLAVATGIVADDETLVGASYRFEWGDGTADTVSSSATAMHTYAASGSYALVFTATDAGGLSAHRATVVSPRVSPPGTPKHPSSTVVMLAWLRQVAGLAPAGAAASLPDVSAWFDTGFVTVPALAGGAPNAYLPERQPVMQVDTWGANRASAAATSVSRKLPLGLANELADKIVLATYLPVPELVLPVQFKPVWLESVYPVSEIRKMPEPDTSYAHFSVDIAMNWIEQTPVI